MSPGPNPTPATVLLSVPRIGGLAPQAFTIGGGWGASRGVALTIP